MRRVRADPRPAALSASHLRKTNQVFSSLSSRRLECQPSGNVGVTHGRSYMKNKSRAGDQPVVGATKLCFDATDEPWPLGDGDEADLLPRDESATLLARATRYRSPAILRRIATSGEELVDREAMGIVIDPSEALGDDPVRDDGLSYGDYVEQLTYLLFLKMAHERTQPPLSRPSAVRLI